MYIIFHAHTHTHINSTYLIALGSRMFSPVRNFLNYLPTIGETISERKLEIIKCLKSNLHAFINVSL